MRHRIHIRLCLDAESPYSSSMGPLKMGIKLEKGEFLIRFIILIARVTGGEKKQKQKKDITPAASTV